MCRKNTLEIYCALPSNKQTTITVNLTTCTINKTKSTYILLSLCDLCLVNMSKGGRNKNNLLGFGFLKGGRDRDYDSVSLSGEPLLHREDSSFSTEEQPERQYGATPDAAILPKSNTTCTTTCSSEGAQLQQSSTQQQTLVIVLYDPNSMLELSASLCQGYVTLLSAGKASEQAKGGNSDNNDNNTELAYAAITDGNVIDVCFGVVSFSSASKATASTMQRIKDVKEIIDDLVNSDLNNNNDGDEITLEGMVVRAYCTSFQNIIQMHDRMKRLNFITKCFCYQRIRHQTMQSIRENFHPLQQKLALLQQNQSQ